MDERGVARLQVDKHIRRLDSDLARFESEIHEKVLTTGRAQDEPIPAKREYLHLLPTLHLPPRDPISNHKYPS